MKHTLMIMLAALVAGTAGAQQSELAKEELSGDHKLYLVHTSKDTAVYRILQQDRPVKFRDAPVPHFAIHTGDNKFIMTIGGQVNPIIGWDLGNDLYQQDDAGGGFVTGQIPVPAQQYKKSDFYINALNANVTLQVVGFGGTDNQLTAFIKLGTDGYKNPLKLKRAYLKWRGFTAGLANSLFEDELAGQPPMIDPQGPCGMVSATNSLINYVTPSFGGFRAAVGVEIPTFNSSNGRYLGKDYKTWKGRDIQNQIVADPNAYNQMAPDVPLWIEWAKSDVNRIRLSAIMRFLNYRDILENKHRTAMGWGVMLSGNFSPVKQLVFNAQAVYGKGIGNYIQDMAGIPLSFTPKGSQPGELTPTPQMGLVFGVSYNINPRWQANAVYSMSKMWKVGDYALSESEGDEGSPFNNYRYCNYVGANVFYNISSYFQVGVEYLYGQRHTFYRGQGHDNRISMQVMFTL